MVITWYGQSCFKIQAGETVLAIDPFDKSIGLTPPRFRADILLVTHDHYDHNNKESINGEPFLISGPGEYEIKGLEILGVESYHDNNLGAKRGKNTIYKIEMDEIRLCHLGDLGQEKLTDKQLQNLGEIDILMIPIGGKFTIDGASALTVVNQIEPRIVIPMHYKIPGLKIDISGLNEFLKEFGAKETKPEEKLTVKKKDLPQEEETKLVVLKLATGG
ncbi:MAG: MBL fold metallo-hydrolase [bacterium]|nr:MBL fold metallo-hydrolase [bacterium]